MTDPSTPYLRKSLEDAETLIGKQALTIQDLTQRLAAAEVRLLDVKEAVRSA